MKKRVVVLGGGTGGLMVANRLARAWPSGRSNGTDLEILLIADQERHLYQPGLLYIALGLTQPSYWHRPQSELLLPSVRPKYAQAERIDVSNRVVELGDGERVPFDYLVIATGSHPDPDAIPGFREAAHSFYTFPEAMRLRGALQTFNEGRVVLIIGVPHKCPAAPPEFLLMYEDMLRKQNKRSAIQLTYTYPIGRLHALEPCADWLEELFAERDIEGQTFVNPDSIDPDAHVVHTLEGEEIAFDLLVGVPPHKGAPVIRNSGLGDVDAWLPTDPLTLQLKGSEGVYVVGDATNLPISKAGSTAHYEAGVIVQNIVNELNGEPPLATYDGKVFCFLEASSTEATHITFDYQHPPVLSNPVNTVHWFKLAFNQMYWASLRGLV